MDLDHFLKDRLRYSRYFFEHAHKPFLAIKKAIESEEAPYVPEYDESGEPQYLQEWLDAMAGVESAGLTALSMVASSLQLFLNDWVSYRMEARLNTEFSRKGSKGWYHAYLKIFREIGLSLSQCPADLELIEQAVLARNRGQHPDQLTRLNVIHSKSDLDKYPSPYFVSDRDKRVIELDSGERSWWLSPNVYVDTAKLTQVIEEVKKLSGWLESLYDNGDVARLLHAYCAGKPVRT